MKAEARRAGQAVLVIDDEDTLARNLAVYLGRLGYEVQTAGSAEEGLAKHADFRADVVLLDHNLPGMSGLEAIEPLRQLDPQASIVLITGYGGTQLAIDAMRRGAADYLAKPLALGELRVLLGRLDRQDRLRSTLRYYQQRDAMRGGPERILGRSTAVQALRQRLAEQIRSAGPISSSPARAITLIHGERGSGKAMAARALHFGGARASMPFVEYVFHGQPVERAEAELFGSEFDTGPTRRRVGLIEAAEGGTLYLQQIEHADLALLDKLAQVAAGGRFRRLGGTRERAARLQFVASMRRPPSHAGQGVDSGAVLFRRAPCTAIEVPPLRARGDDIVLLARHFVALAASRYHRDAPGLCDEAEAALMAHAWPGNVRELGHAIEHAVLHCRGSTVGVRELASTGAAGASVGNAEDSSLDLARMERRLIESALRRSGPDLDGAARLLGTTREALGERLQRLGLDRVTADHG